MFNAIVVALALSLQTDKAPRSDGPCALGPGLSSAVKQRFGSARMLKSADLFEDERGLFGAEHRGACPGMTTGRFFGPKERPAIAFVLLDVEPAKNGRLLVARPALNTWTFLELAELEPGSTVVVWREGPGTFTGSEGSKTLESANDVLILSAYEVWKRAYVWNGRAFEALQLRD